MSRIVVPLEGSEEEVVIEPEGLPEDVSEIIEVLLSDARRNVYLEKLREIAIVYYDQRMYPQYEALMKSVCNAPDDSEFTKDDNLESYLRLLSSFAGFYLRQAFEEMNEDARASLLQRVQEYIGKIGSLDPLNESQFVLNGLAFLLRGEYRRARGEFENSLTKDSNSITSLLGMGCVLYHEGRSREALTNFQRVLRLRPDLVDVRRAIGLCYYDVGNVARADAAFRRVLELDPRNVDGLIHDAIVLLMKNDKETTKRAFGCIQKAIGITGKESPPATGLFLLGQHFFIRGDYAKARSFFSNAYHRTAIPGLLCEILYYLGQIEHAKGFYDKAYNYYLHAEKQDPNYVLNLFRLAQMFLHRREFDEGITRLERLLQITERRARTQPGYRPGLVRPEHFEVHRLLGHLYFKVGRFGDSLRHVRVAMSINDRDERVLILCSLLDRSDFQTCIQCLLKAKEILREKEERARMDGDLDAKFEFGYELWNNLGVLYLMLKNFREAEAAFQESLRLEGCSIEEFFPQRHVTLLFNYAVLHEELGRSDVARDMYLRIVQRVPGYTEVYLRLSMLLAKEGSIREALHWCKVATNVCPNDPNPWLLLGSFHVERGEWNYAQQRFEHVVKHVQATNEFALLSLGAVFFSSRREDRSKEATFLNHASKLFAQVLDINSQNVYAVVSLAASLAQKGYLKDAKAMLTRVKETHPNIPEVLINLGHIAFCEGHHSMAAKYYQLCSTRCYQDQNVDVLLLCAKSLFALHKLKRCKSVLNEVLVLDPRNYVAIYNLCVAQHDLAARIVHERFLDAETARVALEEIRDAQTRLDSIRPELEHSTTARETQLYGKTTKLVSACAETKQRIEQKLEESQKSARKKQLQVDEAVRQRVTAEQTRQKAINHEEEERRRALSEKILSRNRQIQDRIATTLPSSWEEPSVGKKRRRRREPAGGGGRRGEMTLEVIEDPILSKADEEAMEGGVLADDDDEDVAPRAPVAVDDEEEEFDFGDADLEPPPKKRRRLTPKGE